MSKYTLDTYDASPIGSIDNYTQFAIANELAEANRLRRIGLQVYIGTKVSEDRRDGWLEELMLDKA